MNLFRVLACAMAVVIVGLCCAVSKAVAAEPTEPGPTLPASLESGFALWLKSGAAFALDAWRQGGLMERDRKTIAVTKYLKGIEPLVGNYKSYDVIAAQKISQNSQLIYLAINFERGAVYARFLMFRTDAVWVVQNMDFNIKPELIVPWLAFAGSSGAEPP